MIKKITVHIKYLKNLLKIKQLILYTLTVNSHGVQMINKHYHINCYIVDFMRKWFIYHLRLLRMPQLKCTKLSGLVFKDFLYVL